MGATSAAKMLSAENQLVSSVPSSVSLKEPQLSNPTRIGVGLLGLGVVGSGVAQVLREAAERIEAAVGCPVVLEGALVRDPARYRDHEVPAGLITTDAGSILNNPKVDVVVEAMGGQQPALDYIFEAMSQGKHVATANKEVMARHGPEVLAHADGQGVHVRFEASVAGGTPIIGPLLRDLAANDFVAINGIINGTTNYILTKMANEGVDFADALQEAQELGYAEPDPTNDVEGVDAAYKLAILSTLAFRSRVRDTDVYREGISKLKARDFQYARELGYNIKLLAMARKDDGYVQARVHPVFVPSEAPLAKVDGVLNAIEVETDLAGRVLFQGRGAGALPTASALVADLIDITRDVVGGVLQTTSPKLDANLAVRPMPGLETKYYLRMDVIDRAGVLARIATVLGDLDISIDSVIQKGADEQAHTAELVITTHRAAEAAMQNAVRLLEGLEVVREVGNVVRVEDWE